MSARACRSSPAASCQSVPVKGDPEGCPVQELGCFVYAQQPIIGAAWREGTYGELRRARRAAGSAADLRCVPCFTPSLPETGCTSGAQPRNADTQRLGRVRTAPQLACCLQPLQRARNSREGAEWGGGGGADGTHAHFWVGFSRTSECTRITPLNFFIFWQGMQPRVLRSALFPEHGQRRVIVYCPVTLHEQNGVFSTI